MYQRALAIWEQVLGAEHPLTLRAQLSYAVLLAAQHQSGHALQQLKGLEPRLLEFAGTQLHTTLQEQVRRHFLESLSDFQHIVYTLAVQPTAAPDVRAFAADVLLRWKQVQRDEDAYLAGLIRTTPDPVIKRLGQTIIDLRREISHLSHRPQADPAALHEKYHNLNAAEVALAQHSHHYKRHLMVSGLQQNDIRTHLPLDSALLELRVYHPVDFKTRTRGELYWLALLLPASAGEGSELLLQDLGPVTESVPLWQALRAHDDRSPQPSQYLLGDFASLQHWGILRQYDAHHSAARFYQHLFGALDSQLQRFSTLFIAPDSFVHLLPLARLVLPRFQLGRRKARYPAARFLTPPV